MVLEFQPEYTSHSIKIVVDNARTHTAKSRSFFVYRQSIGARTPWIGSSLSMLNLTYKLWNTTYNGSL